MTQAVQVREDQGAVLEQVIMGGDLGTLTPAQRLDYYGRVCESLGLNPLTRPFEYLRLQGKLILYARKDATDQLRMRHRVAIGKPEVQFSEGLCLVIVTGSTGERTDADIGAVTIEGLKGEARANAIMKAITKAKRRLTLSICGLGMLDETEIETVSDSRPARVDAATGEILDGGDVVLEEMRRRYAALLKQALERGMDLAEFDVAADTPPDEIRALGVRLAALLKELPA